ncbi:MAG: GTP cyclohydrolase I [Selenomonadaceae bacterium]|nr:GTP cyclohydrolase I [Selenomonadaceae bacterium]MDY3916909.1 GTP cyclohydrolase I [Selenomonadaceae bacterium]
MSETVNRSAAEQAVRDLLSAFHIKQKPGMEETPQRVVKMLEEVWEGEQYTNEELVKMYNKTFPVAVGGNTDMVVVKDIEAFSYCEHHLALIYNMKVSVGYLPEDKVIGLSKIARIVEMCCKRLQVQERIGRDIAVVMKKIVGPNVIVRIEANHSCMTARGIKKPSSKTVTLAKCGVFTTDASLLDQFLYQLRE